MQELRYANVVSRLRQAIPEFFLSGEQFYEDLPHDVLGTFAQVLCRWLRDQPEGDTVCRAVDFINEMAGSGNDDVVNLLEVSVFEVVCDEQGSYLALRNKLDSPARQILEVVCAHQWSRS